MTKIERELKKCIADPEYFRIKYFDIVNFKPNPLALNDFNDMTWLTVSKENFDISDVDVNEFITYWTQVSKRNPLMRFEREDIFHFPGRLRTWISNKKKFSTVNLLRKTGFDIR